MKMWYVSCKRIVPAQVPSGHRMDARNGAGGHVDINTIAKMAGVSRATVSRYFNNGYVSEEKRRTIAKVVEQTGYVPSQQAQTLRTGKTNLVGVILPKVNSYAVGRMLAGISLSFADTPYQMLLADTNNNKNAEVSYLQLFANRNQVDGLIFIATVFDQAHLDAIAALSCPLVVLGQDLEGHTSVYNDDYRSMYWLVRKVLKHGEHPAYIGVLEEDESAGKGRHRGFLDACRDAGVEVPPQAQAVSAFTLDSGYLCAEKIFDAYPECDTLVCASDNIAYGAMTCAKEYGKRVPEDVQITGVGDGDLSRVVTPTLTTIHHHYKTAGREAARILLQAMQGAPEVSREIRMGYDIQIRNSTRS